MSHDLAPPDYVVKYPVYIEFQVGCHCANFCKKKILVSFGIQHSFVGSVFHNILTQYEAQEPHKAGGYWMSCGIWMKEAVVGSEYKQ